MANAKKIPLIDIVWDRIISHAGKTFTQIEGGTFTYTVESANVIKPDRTDQNIAKSVVEDALAFVPLKDTVSVNHLRAPSYLYAILTDDRIRCLW